LLQTLTTLGFDGSVLSRFKPRSPRRTCPQLEEHSPTASRPERLNRIKKLLKERGLKKLD